MKTQLIPATVLVLGTLTVLSACDRAADVASRNLSEAADNFEINRRVVFYNGITGGYILVVEGRCSLGNFDTGGRMSVTCRTGPGNNDYKKHFLGLSDNVTFFAEQLDGANVSEFHHRVMFRPQSIVPDVDFQGDTEELFQDRN